MDDGNRVGRALAWAVELHAGQTRKGKSAPYLTHVLRVSGLVAKYGGSEIADLHVSVPEPTDPTSVLNHFASATEHLTH